MGDDGYEFDVFLSYRRRSPISDWVRDYFFDELAQWLDAARVTSSHLFIDDEGIETGDDWPLRLRRALQRSRFLVAVWSPNYFASPWCLAELRSMLARERKLSMRCEEDPRGLVFPVKFNDGKYFPPDVGTIEHRDFSEWAYTAASFRQSPKFLEFQAETRTFAAKLAERLDDPPPWRDDFPIELPSPDGVETAPLPRL